MKKAIGVDIGGTKVAAAIVYEDGQFDHLIELPSDITTAESMFNVVYKAISTVLKSSQLTISDIEGIGMGVPGKVDADKGVAVFQNNLPWSNFPIVARIKQAFNIDNVKIDNDVKVAAYAEYSLADMAEDDMFGYITISTGIACTNILNHQIIRGCGFSGEIGFLPVPTSQGLKSIEQATSGPGIQKYAAEIYREPDITTKEVFARWKAGDLKAEGIMTQSATGTAIGIYAMVCLLDPKKIVLGGSVAVKNPEYIQLIKKTLKGMMHAEQYHILDNICVSKLDRDNGIVGAGLIGFRQ